MDIPFVMRLTSCFLELIFSEPMCGIDVNSIAIS